MYSTDLGAEMFYKNTLEVVSTPMIPKHHWYLHLAVLYFVTENYQMLGQVFLTSALQSQFAMDTKGMRKHFIQLYHV